MFDTGDWLGSEVVPYLQQENIDSLDVVIISHPHADHIGQLTQVMESLSVSEVWMSGNTAGSDVFTKSLEAVQNSEAIYEDPRAGDQYDMGPLELTVLHPDALTGKLNEDSLSIHFEFGLTSFLFTGDAYVDGEKEMIASGLPLEADVLQLGHHGSNTSSNEAFINKVDPEIGIYSAGIDNTYGHPHDEVVSLFEKKGIPLYGTDQNGDIIVTSDGTTVEVKNIKQTQVTEKKKTSKIEDANDNEVVQKESMSSCIDINHASKDELTEIIHIGEARAEELIELRPFDTIDDLNKINGIAKKRLTEIKSENKACIGGN